MKDKKTYDKLAVTIVILLCLTIVIAVVGHLCLNSRINQLSNTIPTNSNPSDLQQAMDFTQNQMQTFTWLIGIFITLFAALLAFFGLNTFRSVEKRIEEKYEKKYEKEIKMILEFKDTRAFEKKGIFLYSSFDDKYSNLMHELKNNKYDFDINKIDISELDNVYKDVSIIVYRVKEDGDPVCETLATWCENNKIHCILFCPDKIKVSSELMDKNYNYMSTSIQIAKLRESLYTLLYLAP